MVFHFTDGHKSGTILSNSGMPLQLSGRNINGRGSSSVQQVLPGDHVVEVSGHGLAEGNYLCWDLTFLMASGTKISFEAGNRSWCGSSFKFSAAPDQAVAGLSFSGRTCTGLKTVSATLFLPWNAATHQQLPPMARRAAVRVLMLCTRINNQRVARDLPAIGDSMLHYILSFWSGNELYAATSLQ